MNKIINKLILFIFNPFLGFLESFRSPQLRASRLIIYLWFLLFGFCFIPDDENSNNPGDSAHYAAAFREAHTETFQSYSRDISDYFHNNASVDTRDLYTLTINYLVSRFTRNYHWLFMVFAIVFGLFYIKSMVFILPPKDENYSFLVYPILFLLFCFSNPIFNINGVRFWTALWLATYLLFQVLVNKNYYYLFLAPVTYLIHAGFAVFIFILLLYFLLRRFHGFLNLAFVISLFFTVSSFTSSFYDLSYLLPESLQHFRYYVTEDIIEDKLQAQEVLPLYARIMKLLPRIIINTLVAVCLIHRQQLSAKYDSGRVLDFLVVLMCFVNVTLSIPSVGVRFLKLTVPFLVYLLVFNSKLTNKFAFLVYLIPLAYSYEILHWARHMVNMTEWYLYVAPLPVSILHYL